jgi:hypothetical protein
MNFKNTGQSDGIVPCPPSCIKYPMSCRIACPAGGPCISGRVGNSGSGLLWITIRSICLLAARCGYAHVGYCLNPTYSRTEWDRANLDASGADSLKRPSVKIPSTVTPFASRITRIDFAKDCESSYGDAAICRPNRAGLNIEFASPPDAGPRASTKSNAN